VEKENKMKIKTMEMTQNNQWELENVLNHLNPTEVVVEIRVEEEEGEEEEIRNSLISDNLSVVNFVVVYYFPFTRF
jgi:hypothetical protein